MPLLLIFAFLAGFFTVLSPCILPILPAILSAGTAQGKWRPFGIILGLIVSFTFFTLALTAIVHATGLSPNTLRYAAIILIGLFGLIMIFPKLSDWFAKLTGPIANLGQRVQSKGSTTGFGGGVLFGIALGLLWTPCAGPILAAITTLVATQSISFATILLTLTYSIGAGIPLFLIAYGGGKVIQSSKFLSAHTEGIRQIFGCLMLITAVAIALHWDMALQQQITRFVPPILIEDNALVKQELERLHGQVGGETPQVGSKAPELVGIVNWINSPPLSLMDLQGKIVLIDFWTYSCINCLRTLPYIEKWYDTYKDKGLVVIGVHTPEFEFEKDPKNVAEAASRLGVVYPIAQDNDYKTWQAFHNNYWPAHYLIDQDGKLSMIHFGEGGYAETENAIRELAGLPALEMKEEPGLRRPVTPEIYLGTSRAQNFAADVGIQPDEIKDYTHKEPLSEDKVGLRGKWKVEGERISAAGDESFLDLNFLAKKAYVVLSGNSKKPIEIYLDGQLVGQFKMDTDRKYDVADTEYGRHVMSLKIPEGVNAYTFTFGDE